MATFKETATQQRRAHLTVYQLWLSFHLVGRICESGANFYTISQVGLLAGVAVATTCKFLEGMLLNTKEALLGTAPWKRVALLLGVVGLSAAYFLHATVVFRGQYRYLTQCTGSPSLIAMELIVVMAYAPLYVSVALSKHPRWLQ